MYQLESGSLWYETKGKGSPMLLMHGGLGLDHTTLRPWLDPLAKSVQLIYYDHLGNGRSIFTGESKSLDHSLWVETADELREHLRHDALVVFGHSYGALLALEYALRYGDRLRGLILSNVAAAFDYPETVLANARRKSPDEATLQAVMEVFSGPMAGDAVWAEAFREISPLYFYEYDPSRYEEVLRDVQFRAEPANRGTFGCLPTYQVEERLDEIKVPTLVLSGADDWIMPPECAGKRVADGIPDAEHVVFERSGHWPFVEENVRFLNVVQDWLIRKWLTAPLAGKR